MTLMKLKSKLIDLRKEQVWFSEVLHNDEYDAREKAIAIDTILKIEDLIEHVLIQIALEESLIFNK